MGDFFFFGVLLVSQKKKKLRVMDGGMDYYLLRKRATKDRIVQKFIIEPDKLA